MSFCCGGHSGVLLFHNSELNSCPAAFFTLAGLKMIKDDVRLAGVRIRPSATARRKAEGLNGLIARVRSSVSAKAAVFPLVRRYVEAMFSFMSALTSRSGDNPILQRVRHITLRENKLFSPTSL